MMVRMKPAVVAVIARLCFPVTRPVSSNSPATEWTAVKPTMHDATKLIVAR